MTLKELKIEIDKLMDNEDNWNKQVIGDIRPGQFLNKVELYSKWFIVLYDDREK